MASRTRSSSRPSLAVLLALLGVVAVPAGVAYSRYSTSFSVLDASWLIPLAALGSVGALFVIRGTGGHVRWSAGPVRTLRVARILVVLGICITLSAAIAVGFYELLLRLEG